MAEAQATFRHADGNNNSLFTIPDEAFRSAAVDPFGCQPLVAGDSRAGYSITVGAAAGRFLRTRCGVRQKDPMPQMLTPDATNSLVLAARAGAGRHARLTAAGKRPRAMVYVEDFMAETGRSQPELRHRCLAPPPRHRWTSSEVYG